MTRSEFLLRPRLVAALHEATRRRLTLVQGDAGAGKTVLVGHYRQAHPHIAVVNAEDVVAGDARMLAHKIVAALALPGVPIPAERGPQSIDASMAARLGGAVCAAVDTLDGPRRVLVIDAADLLYESPHRELLESLVRQLPAGLALVLVARRLPPFPLDRLRAEDAVAIVGGHDLLLTADEVAALGRGVGSASALEAVHAATAGWPLAVGVALHHLRARADRPVDEVLEQLARDPEEGVAELIAEVLDTLDAESAEALRVAAVVPDVSSGLLAHLGLERATITIDRLVRGGVLLQPIEPDRARLPPVVRAVVNRHLPLHRWGRTTVVRRASGWARSRGDVVGALRVVLGERVAVGGDRAPASHTGADDALQALLVDILREDGIAALHAGASREIARALDAVAEGGDEFALLRAELCRITGRWDECLAHLAVAAGERRPMPVAVAWRIGLIHHMRGEFAAALATYHDADAGEDAAVTEDEAADVAMLLAWHASACFIAGDVPRCEELAQRALGIATRIASQAAKAAAHAALALVAADAHDSLGHDRHAAQALEAADRAGDVLQRIRVLVNSSATASEQGRYDHMFALLDEAVVTADLAGDAHSEALALCNRADALMRMGELDAALADAAEAREIFNRNGSTLACYADHTAGQLLLLRGDTERARSVLRGVVATAEETDNAQVLGLALALLARSVAVEDTDASERAAARALEVVQAIDRARVLVDVGWAALRAGRAGAAADHADTAVAMAETMGQPPVLASALLLRGLAGEDLASLRRAADVAEEVGDPVEVAATELTLAVMEQRPDQGAAGELRRLGAVGLLREITAALQLGTSSEDVPPAAAPSSDDAAVRITTLGAFQVEVAGRVIADDEWRSRKARDLVKILLAEGGSARTDVVTDALWPHEGDSAKLANRLNVAVSTARRVLGTGQLAGTEILRRDGDILRLDPIHVVCDVDEFLSLAAEATRLYEAGEEAAGLVLRRAERAYTGDFLPDAMYVDWAATIRAEARSRYVDIATILTREAADRGDPVTQARMARRVLTRDEFHEPSHLLLVRALEAAGRRGEARRAYQAYVEAMADLSVEAAPYPAGVRIGTP